MGRGGSPLAAIAVVVFVVHLSPAGSKSPGCRGWSGRRAVRRGLSERRRRPSGSLAQIRDEDVRARPSCCASLVQSGCCLIVKQRNAPALHAHTRPSATRPVVWSAAVARSAEMTACLAIRWPMRACETENVQIGGNHISPAPPHEATSKDVKGNSQSPQLLHGSQRRAATVQVWQPFPRSQE